MDFSVPKHDMLTQKQKEQNDNEWYKERARGIDALCSNVVGFGGIGETDRMKTNYDLFNNIVNMKDFDYVVKPFGDNLGELPATLTNRDICSAKIKVLHGLELKRPFGWKVLAVNEEATTRKEQAEFQMISQFVVNSIMLPIKQEIEMQYQQQQQQGQPLTADQQQKIQQQIAQELEAKTPEEVRKYMKRTHQDPAEAMMHQILEYIIQKEQVEHKFHRGWKHATLSAKEVYNIGIRANEPYISPVNPIRFNHDTTKEENDFIEDSSWARAEYRMTPDQIVNYFGDKLTKKQIEDEIYGDYNLAHGYYGDDLLFDFSTVNYSVDARTKQVFHYNLVSLRKVGFVKYLDEEGQEQEDMVGENYQMNPALGDISIEWEWIPQVHEMWKLGRDLFIDCRPVPGQHKDLDNLHSPKLSYYGVSYDNMNSEPTSPMDRIKGYQYLYNIVMYRIELLMASDQGKLLLMNIKAIPRSMGIDVDKWTYFLNAAKIGWVNPSEEGAKGTDVTNMAKEIDMSLVSDISRYMNIAEYLENKAGSAIGVTKQMEGEIATSDAVTNTKQSIIQGTTILEPLFDLHNQVKQRCLTGLVEQAKIAWSGGKPKKLSYILDDMSVHMLTVDQKLLDASTYGLFVLNSSKSAEAKKMVENLAHAAMQNQMIEMSDVVKIIRSEGIQESEELLEISEDKKHARDLQKQTAATEAQAQEAEKQREFQRETWKHDDAQAITEIKEKGKIDLQKATIQALGFAEDKDIDKDREPDVLEVYKHGLDAMVVQGKLDQMESEILLKEKEFEHQKEVDKEKLRIEDKKASQKPKGK